MQYMQCVISDSLLKCWKRNIPTLTIKSLIIWKIETPTKTTRKLGCKANNWLETQGKRKVFRRRWEVNTCLAVVHVHHISYYWKSIKSKETGLLWGTGTEGIPKVKGGNTKNKTKPLANQPTSYMQVYTRGMWKLGCTRITTANPKLTQILTRLTHCLQ